MTEPVQYIHLPPESALPVLDGPRPFRAVLVLETEVEAIWQGDVSRWLVESGCLYALSFGPRCSSWDDSIDEASLEKFDFGEVPPAHFVLTTWHDDEPLSEVFWFAKYNASHPTETLAATVLIHVAAIAQEAELLESFEAA